MSYLCSMKKFKVALLLLLYLAGGMSVATMSAQTVRLASSDLALAIDKYGFYKSITIAGQEVLLEKELYPVVMAVAGDELLMPQQCRLSGDTLVCLMTDDLALRLLVRQSAACLTLEVAEAAYTYDAVFFGPVAVNLHDVVGDVVGVVQGGDVAMGVMALNTKTTSGLLQEYGPRIEKQLGYSGRSACTSTSTILSYNLAATEIEGGAVFQMSCRRRFNRAYGMMFESRRVNDCPAALVSPVAGPDGDVMGAKIAMFGCRRDAVLGRIAEIEMQQGLPHPMLDGEWLKTSRKAMASYMISDFSRHDLDFVLDKCAQAGWKYLYHIDPFSDWGHFHWDTALASSDAEMRQLVERAARRGVKMGVHTLSNFITTNDAYVTPKPSKYLLRQMQMQLYSDIDTDDTVLAVIQPPRFSWDEDNCFDETNLRALIIDDEIITYTHGYDSLFGCTRGAFGTRPAKHSHGSTFCQLWDHPYKKFFPDLTLQDSMADRLAEVFNTTGLAQISFDGLEGCRYTGQDDYAVARFVSRCYEGWDHEVINDGSILTHYNWHINTRMNWGEPWGAAMRKGQVENRIKNQDFFRRNLFPRMLGWFLIRTADLRFEATTLEDLEWAMSEAAGFDGGYGMTCYMNTLQNHGQIDRLLESVRLWDSLRMADAFPDSLKARLRQTESEWHLERGRDGRCVLYPLYVSKYFSCNLGEMQPGQPGGADWVWESPAAGAFSLRLWVVDGGAISEPAIITAAGTVRFHCTIGKDEYLLLDADGSAVRTDKNYNIIEKVRYNGVAKLPQGQSPVSFSCQAAKGGGEAPLVDVRYVVRAAGIAIP